MIGSSLLLASVLPSTLLNGLVAYWKLDGNANEVRNLSNATPVGAGSVSYGSGKIGQAAQFTQPVGLVASDAEFPMGTGAKAIAFWILYGGGLNANVFGVGAPSDLRMIDLIAFNSGQIGVHWYGHSATEQAASISIGSWSHYAMTYDGAILRAFSNGVQQGAGYPVALNTLSDGTLRLGAGKYDRLNNFSGLLDEFGIWNRALSALEIAELYNAGAGKTHPF